MVNATFHKSSFSFIWSHKCLYVQRIENPQKWLYVSLACFRSTFTSINQQRGASYRGNHCRHNHPVFDRRWCDHVPQTPAEHGERRVSVNAFMSNIYFLLSISFLARTSKLFLYLSFSMHLNWCVHGIACVRTTVIAKHPVVSPFQRPPETQAASSDEVWQLDRKGEWTFLHQSPLSAHIWHSLSTPTYWAFFIIQCWDYLQFSRLHAAIKTELVRRRICINHHKIDLWIQTFEEHA